MSDRVFKGAIVVVMCLNLASWAHSFSIIKLQDRVSVLEATLKQIAIPTESDKPEPVMPRGK